MHLDRIDLALAGGGDVPLPRVIPVEQRFPRDEIADVERAVRESVSALPVADLAGKRVAVTAGSRGIPHIVEVLATVFADLRQRGAEPFLVPAMGSHGGATAEGQVEVLTGYGITEQSVGAPILSSMDAVETARIEGDIPLYCDRHAYEADGIVVVNKIKPHANYKGDIESGLCKMLVIGLGKRLGATMFHGLGFARFPEIVPQAAMAQVERLPVIYALGLVENAYGGLAVIEAMEARQMVAREKKLLRLAKHVMGKLLMDSIDVLVVDEIGKDISGQGMDPTVTGRAASGLPGFVAPPIQRIVVRSLSAASHGNASGIGLADLTTVRCADTIDFTITYTNAVTARNLEGARLPVVANSDREAIDLALRTSRDIAPGQARIVRIRNTKKLYRILMSEAYLPEIEASDDFAVIGEPRPITFDADGWMTD